MTSLSFSKGRILYGLLSLKHPNALYLQIFSTKNSLFKISPLTVVFWCLARTVKLLLATVFYKAHFLFDFQLFHDRQAWRSRGACHDGVTTGNQQRVPRFHWIT